jgi:uncharacterized protein YcbX
MRELFVSAVNVYPVKSLGGISLAEAVVEQRGLAHDRRWMLVYEDGTFFTQREHPRMALVSLRVEAEGLRATAPGMEELLIPFELNGAEHLTVRVWKSVCDALVVRDETSEWFSRYLGAPCKLVYMPDETRRKVNPEYAVGDDIVSFADGYPFHLIGEASLEDLNTRLDEKLPMNRFRPNFVVNNSPPFAEDNWKQVRIGETLFHVVKSCERCAITTIDQTTAARGQEPLKTLAKFRLQGDGIFFGRHLVADEVGGEVKVGDPVEVVKEA